MAEVFKATSESAHGYMKEVAIKRVLPSLAQNTRFIRMFLDEAKLSLHLNHPNIVHVFDLGRAGETYFIVMEYVDGIDVRDMVTTLRNRDEQLSPQEVAFIALEISKGLHHAHNCTDEEGNELKVVHRDVSPPNLLVSREGEVKITDFGIAKARSRVEETGPKVVKGKFSYLSPEAASGETVDQRSDIFSLGTVMWELLTKRKLFNGETDVEVLNKVKAADIPDIETLDREVPNGLKSILQTALEKSPGDRFQSAQQMGNRLSEFLFKFGQPVTNFQLAERVEQLLDKTPRRSDPMDEFAENVVEQELGEFVSLEELDELDKILAERFSPESDEGDTESSASDEDPRHWWEGAASSTDSGAARDIAENSPDNTWKEGELSELIEKVAELDSDARMKPESSTDTAQSTPTEAERLKSYKESTSSETNPGDFASTSIWTKLLIFFGLASVALMFMVMVFAFLRIQ
jgi:serine/threonine-protein kinase